MPLIAVVSELPTERLKITQTWSGDHMQMSWTVHRSPISSVKNLKGSSFQDEIANFL